MHISITKRLLYPFLFSVLFITACESRYRRAADEILDQIPTPTDMNVGDQNYLLDIPDGWKTENVTYRGINYYFLKAPQTATDPNTSINVITEYMHNLDLGEFHKKTIESIKQTIPSAKITAEGSIEAHGLRGSWYAYTMEPGGIKASLISYIFPKNGVAYIITAGTQPEDVSRYRKTFDGVAKSLTFCH